MNIWIMDNESGINLLYKAYMEMEVNEDLVSGLLTALNQLTKFEFKQGIDSVEMGGLKWVYLENKEYNLLFIAADTKNVNSNVIRGRLTAIKTSFITKYVKNKTHWEGIWKGNVEIFAPFKDLIDEYYSQCKQAESIATLAEFFDILGIFQQVLNLNFNMIQENISGVKKENILKRIEQLFYDYSIQEDVKNDLELSKISFQRYTGFNIININPAKSDLLVVEKHIIGLLNNVVKIIKEEVGYIACLNYFINEKILDYILSNISLLSELNLFQYLLKLILLK